MDRPYARTTAHNLTNGAVSFWYDQIGLPTPGAALPGDTDCDVCIVGGGLTGLWTAYYLAKAPPGLRIVVLEAEFAGFGASGRNGGWLSAELAGNRDRYARTGGRDGVRELTDAMVEAVDEVIAVCAQEGIDADIVKGGVVYAARTQPQLVRMRESIASSRRWGLDDTYERELSRAEVLDRVRAEDVLGGVLNPQCARVQPAKLVRGVAEAVRRLGVSVYEDTRVDAIEPGRAISRRGTVHAEYVLRCLEGYTAGIAGHRREWLPMNSAMIATEPLPPAVWDQIGWSGAELLGDFANAYSYAQRTADGRIAIGGRGVPYRFGSRTDVDGQTQQWTIESLTKVLHSIFPATRDISLAHAWCGVLGVPRDWCASVSLDRETGLGWAGGYVGSGLTTTNLAGRTLRDLVLGHDTALTRLPWTGRRVRRWEPEPLRWLGVKAMYGLYREADRREATGLQRPSRLARLGDLLTGH